MWGRKTREQRSQIVGVLSGMPDGTSLAAVELAIILAQDPDPLVMRKNLIKGGSLYHPLQGLVRAGQVVRDDAGLVTAVAPVETVSETNTNDSLGQTAVRICYRLALVQPDL